MGQFLGWVLFFIAVVPSIVLHEVSHGYVAFLLGDPTAKNQGRLSLNPVRHVDPFGTLLLPLIFIVIAGVPFGYAKPVPINPYRFRDYRRGFFLSSIAGPGANFVLASAGAVLTRLLSPLPGLLGLVGEFFFLFVSANLVLMFFNLIPIPPLDGSRIIPLFLSDRGMQTYHAVERYGFLILLLLVFAGPRLGLPNPIGWYFGVTVEPLLRLLTGA